MKPSEVLWNGQNPGGRIVALGELLVDFVPENTWDRIRDAGKIIKTASGSSGIFACAAARLGAKAGFIGKVGKDALSQFVSETIVQQGVDLSGTVSSDQGQIGLAFIEYTQQGRNYQFYRKNSVGSAYARQDVKEEYIEEAFLLHYSGMLLELSEDMLGACKRAVEIARQHGVLVSFDPNIRKELLSREGAKERLMEAVRTADLIMPTMEEAQYLTGCSDVKEILQKLHGMGPRLVALTRDAQGAILSCGGQVEEVEALKVDAIDPTGAGDAFAAAMACALQRDFSLREMGIFANCAGGLTASRRGCIGLALPDLAQVEQAMREREDVRQAI
ncbi:MAG: sugar kinase [Eubacteriales bacterium]|jgi:sugar/nucleoside kinase (ribokinase family)